MDDKTISEYQSALKQGKNISDVISPQTMSEYREKYKLKGQSELEQAVSNAQQMLTLISSQGRSRHIDAAAWEKLEEAFACLKIINERAAERKAGQQEEAARAEAERKAEAAHTKEPLETQRQKVQKRSAERIRKSLELYKTANEKAQCEQLFSAIESNDYQTANTLIAAGADVNYIRIIGKNSDVKVPLLIYAIIKGNVQLVKLLLSKGADPDCERLFDDGRRFSALRDSIAEWPNDEIAQLLIEAGADVNYIERNSTFSVPILINAIYKGNVQLVKLLLSKGAHPDCERLFDDGRRFSALRDSIAQWPNDEITGLLAEKIKTKPKDIQEKYPKDKFSPSTKNALKELGVKFSLF